ncbi:hypothetical protein [Antribacter gilvus]|uniref:hypothetical protein n=1 Tax=Antribacter gilvus TaxID=2304675 RepID=UPI0013E0A19C|nr:hypothetical protein [Antribacter gilvus]
MTAEIDTTAAEKLAEAVTESVAEPTTSAAEPAEATKAPAAEAPAAAVVPAAPAEPAAEPAATKPAAEPAAGTAVVATTAETAAPAEVEDPQSNVFSIVGFLLAYIPLVGVVVNIIAINKAGKEGFDRWLAGWALGISITTTVGTLALVALGFWIGVEAAQSGFTF